MCGICGIINFNYVPVTEAEIREMMKCLKHRGPNDEGIFIDKNIGLGFLRLSILDLSSQGHQPMFDDTGRFMIIHNGEVYNYIELREELKKKGYSFRSNTDTEVILKSFVEWGEECLDKFNGMWSFTIYDRDTKKLFCARDRFGIKPFYYYWDNIRFIFASEIPPILLLLNSKPNPNHQAVFDYMVFNRTDQTEQTFFKEIKKLPHGHTLTLELQGFDPTPQINKWYDLRKQVYKSTGFDNAEEFRELFQSAVGLRLRSDVPVGVCLSGGLDSSSIVSVLLKEYRFEDLHTFSAVYGKGRHGDESDFIREFNGLVRHMHFTYPSEQTLYEDLECFVRAHAEPIPSTAPYAQFKVMELAKDHVVVTLDGQGADESLGGYHYFFGYYFKDLLKHWRLLKLLHESVHYAWQHRSLFGLKSFVYFMTPQKTRTNLRVAEKEYLKPLIKEYNSHSVIASELYGSANLQEALINHFEYKLEHLLKWEDRNSMWFSLEARVPFLDYRLVEKMLATGSKLIIDRGTTKVILREAMNGTLPEKIRQRRDKVGFETPQDEWFRTPLFQKLIKDLLESTSFRDRGLINTDKAKHLYQKHLNNQLNISKEIWKWLHLEMWYRQFID